MYLFTYQDYLKYSNKIRKIMPKERKEYIEKLKEGVNEDMKFEKYFIEWLEEKEMEGIAKAIKQMVKEMIKNNIDDEQIMKIAKIDKKELEKLKIA